MQSNLINLTIYIVLL